VAGKGFSGESSSIGIMRIQLKTGISGGTARAWISKALVLLVLCLTFSLATSAQISSAVGSVALQANMASSLTVSATPGLVNFTLATSGVSTGSAVISVKTTWSLNTFISQVSCYAYFTAPASALTDVTGHKIPATNVSGSVNGGAFTAFTGTSPYAAASSVTLFNQFVLGFNILQSRTDTLNLQINTTGLGLVPGNYTGVLFIQAQAL
jgi:hypothetical protein